MENNTKQQWDDLQRDFENYLDGKLVKSRNNSPGRPGKKKLESWLNRNLKVQMTDGRVLIGIFLCTDRDANIILGSCNEYLKAEDCLTEEPKILGLVMVPGRHIVLQNKSQQQALAKTEGAIAIITGGGSGIGYAAACELLRNGAQMVIIGDKNEKAGTTAADSLCFKFGMSKACYMPCDVTNSFQFDNLFQETLKYFNKVDVVFNNAGIFDDNNWERSIDTNLTSVIRGNLLAQKYMKNGVVINNSATAGLLPWTTCPIFSATKHAVVTLSECYGDKFYTAKRNNRVVGLCPGLTDTSHWENSLEKNLNPEWGENLLRKLSFKNTQMVDYVGKAVVHLVRYGISGQIYTCENGLLKKNLYPHNLLDEIVLTN